MARIIEEVAVRIGADTRGLEKGLKKADVKVSRLTQGIKRMGFALAGAFGARAVVRGFKRTLDTTDALIKTARGVGFTASEYQRLTFALDQVGVSAGSAKIALGDFQKRLAKPQFHKFFKEAGLDPKALQKMSPAADFDSAFKHLATLVDDPRAPAFFGTIFEEQAGKDMLKAARSLETLTKAYRAFDSQVGSIGGQGARNIERLTFQTKTLATQWESLKATLVGEIAPAVTVAIEGLTKSGLLAAMGRDIASLITLMNDFGDATKLAMLEFERFTGGGPKGTPLSIKNKATGERAISNVPDLSPSGAFSKTIDPRTVHEARIRNAQQESPYSLVQNYDISLTGFSSGTKAAQEMRKELERQKRQ